MPVKAYVYNNDKLSNGVKQLGKKSPNLLCT